MHTIKLNLTAEFYIIANGEFLIIDCYRLVNVTYFRLLLKPTTSIETISLDKSGSSI